ncbi:RES family NAD+ phosphorylase [Flavobacterium sp.]|uniref:RES family NAD+ phosphorylase n=1 Tax=Flavobacterium sp. TaxID=239 RepID=UPI003D6A836A
MNAFRLARKKYAIELSGKGASIAGARWNSKGTEIVYCAESRALAMAEVVVHVSLATLPSDFVMLKIDIPDTVSMEMVDMENLEINWNVFPFTFSTQLIGDDFVRRNEACVLKVPSAVVKGDFNYLINQYHADFKMIKIVEQIDFPFDKRIFK